MTAESVTPSLSALITAQTRRLHDHEFLVTQSGTLSYGETERMANAAAQMLLDRGVREGSIVMARCHNGPEVVATWFACLKIGAVFLPLNSLLSGEPLLAVMRAVQAEHLVCDATLLAAVEQIRHDLPSLHHVLVVGAGNGADSFEAALERAGSGAPASPVDNPSAPSKLMFTSGTTGEPKGVIWSRNAELVHGIKYGDELVRIDEGETAYSCLPLFHATCQGTLLGTLLHGGRFVVDRRFEPFSFWKRTRESGAVFFPYVGTIISTLGARPERPDDAGNPVRRAMGSAAPADRWTVFERRFDLTLEDVWGQTETASCWTRPTPGTVRPGTVGHPTDRWEARVMTSEGREASVGETGELWMRPGQPNVMFAGYFGESGGLPLDTDGWYHTGDLLSPDSDGDLVFRGRLRESIRRRGEMIAPAAIESVAHRYPAVGEAAAVGVPAEDGVEDDILLCVVPHEGETSVDHAKLHAFLQAELPAFMVPRYLRVLPELPKTPTTRVRRHVLSAEGHTGSWDSRARRRSR